MFRVSTKDRTFVDEVHHKGLTVKLADWLHLANPDDPSRPIVAQVFKCWLSEEPAKKGQPYVTACWYYRPEQTFHPSHRQFWEREVFKTGHFADHALEDMLEKISCQFTARHIRGRPRPPFWYPGWPLYVCDSRYNDRERIFVRIKNWNSCVPEEVRKSTEFMPIYPFERLVFPYRYPSPFMSGKPLYGKPPGGIGDAIERAEGEKIEGGGTGRKRPKRGVTAAATPSRSDQTDRAGPSKGMFVGSTPQVPGAAAASAYPGPSQPPQPVHSGNDMDRSLVTAAGVANLGSSVVLERLPSETARHFDRDPETNEVLWFAAPPVDIAHHPGPRYSLAYLHYLAKKRKLTHDASHSGEDVMQVDTPDHAPPLVRPSTTAVVNKLLAEYGFA